MSGAVLKFPTNTMHVPREGWDLLWDTRHKHLLGSTQDKKVAVTIMSILTGKTRKYGGDLVVHVEPHKKISYEAEYEYATWEAALDFLIAWAEEDLGMKLDPSNA